MSTEGVHNLVVKLLTDIQKKVIVECEKMGEKYNDSYMTIEEYRSKIANVFNCLKVIISEGEVSFSSPE